MTCTHSASTRAKKTEAWHSCRQLRIVKLPSTVVSISDNAFRSCKLLNSVTAPGCREFSYKAFDECCSLQWVYTTEVVLRHPPWFLDEMSKGQGDSV